MHACMPTYVHMQACMHIMCLIYVCEECTYGCTYLSMCMRAIFLPPFCQAGVHCDFFSNQARIDGVRICVLGIEHFSQPDLRPSVLVAKPKRVSQTIRVSCICRPRRRKGIERHMSGMAFSACQLTWSNHNSLSYNVLHIVRVLSSSLAFFANYLRAAEVRHRVTEVRCDALISLNELGGSMWLKTWEL